MPESVATSTPAAAVDAAAEAARLAMTGAGVGGTGLLAAVEVVFGGVVRAVHIVLGFQSCATPAARRCAPEAQDRGFGPIAALPRDGLELGAEIGVVQFVQLGSA